MSDIMRGMDLLVLTSRWEGMANVLLEAGASGRPVVASDVEGVREVVRDGKTGIIYPVEDIEALSAAVERLVRDRELRLAMGRAAREHVAGEFSLERMVEEYRRFYLRLIGER